MILLEKHILLNYLIEQKERLIKMANKIDEMCCPHPNPDTHKDYDGFKKSVEEYKKSERGLEEIRLRQMAKDLQIKINKYQQHILNIALNKIEEL